MDVNIMLRKISVNADSKEEAIEKVKIAVKEDLLVSEIPYDEDSFKVDKKSITMSDN